MSRPSSERSVLPWWGHQLLGEEELRQTLAAVPPPRMIGRRLLRQPIICVRCCHPLASHLVPWSAVRARCQWEDCTCKR